MYDLVVEMFQVEQRTSWSSYWFNYEWGFWVDESECNDNCIVCLVNHMLFLWCILIVWLIMSYSLLNLNKQQCSKSLF